MWVCPLDGMENQDDSATCVFCGSPKPSNTVQPIPGSTTRPEPDDSASDELFGSTGHNVVLSKGQYDAPNVDGDPSRGNSVLVLTDIASRRRIRVDRDFGIVGRDGDFDPDAFEGTVSRQHLVVARRGSTWAIRHIGRNESVVYTQRDAIPVPRNMEYPLHGGESLKLGTMYFDVSVEEPSIEGERPASLPDEARQSIGVHGEGELIEGWFVDCPVCGSAISVAGEGERIRECPRCIDGFDKKRVSRINPVFGTRQRETVIDVH